MHFLRTQWNLKPRSVKEGGAENASDTLTNIAQAANHSVARETLSARGWSGREEALNLRAPHDPFLMKGMAEAAALILDTLEKGGRIMIHGDYDCDGLTATALLAKALLSACPEDRLFLHIPNRITEGYGLAEEGIDRCLEERIDLLITVDCGIRSSAEVARLTEAGVKVVVTDHHEPGEAIPAADAVVNPHLTDCSYPCTELSGAGVAWKLTQALELLAERREQRSFSLSPPLRQEIMALAALGTLADQMVILDENRWLVRAGLEALKRGAVPGLQALFRKLKLDVAHLTSTDLVFSVAPKLNAAGRLGSERIGLDLLYGQPVDSGTVPLSSEPYQGRFALEKAADELLELNIERRTLERLAVREARLMLSQAKDTESLPVLVVAGDSWHVGVLGIVAARLVDIYDKPALVLTREESGTALPLRSPEVSLKGSGRSVEGVDLLSLLTDCSDLLEAYGGHTQAAGLGLRGSNLDALKEGLAAAWQRRAELEPDGIYARRTDRSSGKPLSYDLAVSPSAWTMAEARDIEALGPFGSGMEEPIYRSDGLRVLDCRTLGKDGHHLRLTLASGSGSGVGAIAFGKGELAPLIRPGDRIDALYYLSINYWRGRETLQLNIQDLKLPPVNAYEAAPPALPGKDCLRTIWPALDQLLGEHETLADISVLTAYIGTLMSCQISQKEVLLSIRIFAESGLLSLTELSSERILLRQTPQDEQVSLEASETFRLIRAEGGSDL